VAKRKEPVQPTPEDLFNTALELVYTMFTMAIIEANGDFSERVINQVLPGLTLDAAALFLSEEEPDPGPVEFGQHYVTPEFKAEFLERIAKPIQEIRTIMADLGELQVWKTPTPAQVVKRFCLLNHLRISTDFPNLIVGNDHDDTSAVKRRLMRLMNTPDEKARLRDRSQVEFARRLHKVITTHDPKRTANITVDDLIWTKK
jgi:hypothetical protein